jgi:hypothetical protein
MTQQKYRTGYLADAFDSRDHPLFAESDFQDRSSDRRAATAAAPAKPFILPDLPPVYNQGDISSYTADAACAALRYAYRKYSGKEYSKFDPSRLFAYYWGRVYCRPEDLNEPESLDDIRK